MEFGLPQRVILLHFVTVPEKRIATGRVLPVVASNCATPAGAPIPERALPYRTFGVGRTGWTDWSDLLPLVTNWS